MTGIQEGIEVGSILGWMDAPRAGRGIRFAVDKGWEHVGYDELAERCRAAAVQIAEAGEPGRVVSLILPTGPGFVAAFYGTLLAGCTPSPIAPPGYFQGFGDYRAHLTRMLPVARPGLVITDSRLAPVVAEATAQVDGIPAPMVLDPGARDTGPVGLPRAPLAVLQFTSGSSGTPKGARVTWGNLEAGVGITARFLRYGPESKMASWLPLYHDMGLIGSLVLSVTQQGDFSCLSPDQFIRSPLRYLECYGRDGATISANPTFGHAYMAKRVPADALAGMDFSGWDRAGVGAERIGPAGMTAFARHLAPFGFRPGALTAGYGMAEATLQVTGTDYGVVPTALRVDSAALRFGEPVSAEPAPLMESGADDAALLISSGRPSGDFTVEIVGEDGDELPAGHLGEIVVRGSAVVDGYEGAPAGQETRLSGGTLRTGDAAFVRDGELFVLGRMGDAFSTRGRTVYLEDVEAHLAQDAGLPVGRAVVLAGQDRVVAVVEMEPGDWVARARAVLVRQCGADRSIAIRCAERGAILRTSSGKPRRRQMWQDLLEGRLPGADAA
jgi:fatty-acyl-CoA synthase